MSSQTNSHRTFVGSLYVILLGIGSILLLAVIYLGREQVQPAGPRGAYTLVHDRWTGNVWRCSPYGRECTLIYPPTPEPVAQGAPSPPAGTGAYAPASRNFFDQFDAPPPRQTTP